MIEFWDALLLFGLVVPLLVWASGWAVWRWLNLRQIRKRRARYNWRPLPLGRRLASGAKRQTSSGQE